MNKRISSTQIIKKPIWNRSSGLDNKIINASKEYLSGGFLNAVYMFSNSNGFIKKGAEGYHSIEKKEKLTPDQIMQIASGTKIITATAIMKLRDKKLLDVGDTIVKHLDRNSGIWIDNKVPDWANEITIHDLLIHRSGLSEYFMVLQIDTNKTHKEINKDIANLTKTISFTPGEKHDYCNTNYVILGLIIEQASDMNLGNFYKKELFDPLMLNDTKLSTLEEALEAQRAQNASIYPERYFVTPTGSTPHFNLAKIPFTIVPFADGGVVSTAQDLIKWHQALHSGKVVSKESYNLMTRKYYEAPGWHGVKNYIGYGLYISELENGDVLYQHAGRAVGVRSESGCIPKKDLCFAVLSNTMNYIPKELEGKIDIKLPENQLDIQHFLGHIFKAI